MIHQANLGPLRRNRTTVLLAVAAFGITGPPAAQAEQPLASPAVATAQESTPEGKQLFVQLGSRILSASRLVAREQHKKHPRKDQETTTRDVSPTRREVRVSYDARPVRKGGAIGTYELTADFKVTRRNRKILLKNLVAESVSENAGAGGASAELDFRKNSSGDSFAGVYKANQKAAPVNLLADTTPTNIDHFRAAVKQAQKIAKTARRHAPIKPLLPPFIMNNAPVTNAPDVLPVVPPAPPAPQVPPAPNQPPQSPSLPGSPYKTGANGVDVSWPNCGTELPAGVDFGIVGVNNGQGYSTNPCLPNQVATYKDKLSLYVYGGWYDQSTHIDPNNPRMCATGDANCLAYNYGYNAGTYALKAAADAGARSSTWWIDVESNASWSADTVQNQNSIQGEHDALAAGGVTNVGVYSTTAMWNNITGGWQNKWPSWGATTWSTAQEASQYCTGHEFTGGPTWLLQYDPVVIDKNVAC